MLTRSNSGVHVWLMTSRHTDPAVSSTLGWYMRFTNPTDGLLYGYPSGYGLSDTARHVILRVSDPRPSFLK